jgi:acetate kinase
MSDTILVINAGSSSIKFSVFDIAGDQLDLLVKGQVEGIGTAPRFVAWNSTGTVLAESEWKPVAEGQGHANAFDILIAWLQEHLDGANLLAVGHRVVHGGPHLSGPMLIDNTVLATLDTIVPLMPLHLPHNLTAIRAISKARPELPQVACFDTAFHHGHPRVADQFGLPWELYEQGVRRYGFHGISYEYIASRLKEIAPEAANGRVVIAHLGSGASLCAIKNGRSIDTTMGFSALDGLLMGTRCGALDPGALLYLMKELRMTADELETLLYKKSGLLGLSGISNDLRDLIGSDEPRAQAAIDYFVYRIGQALGAMTAALGGLDALVFTAGIGEHSPEIRQRVCKDAAWLGIELDLNANARNERRISCTESSPSVWMIPTDEEWMIARHTSNCVQALQA